MYFSIGLDNGERSGVKLKHMKVAFYYKERKKFSTSTLQKDMVDFASGQFKVLLKKNLGIPVKSFQL